MTPKTVYEDLPTNLTFDKTSGRYRYRWPKNSPRTTKPVWLGKDKAKAIAYAERLNLAVEYERLAYLQKEITPTFGNVIDLYIQFALPQLPIAPTTAHVHLAALNRYKVELGDMSLKAVDRLVIARWIRDRTENNEVRNKHRLRFIRLYDYAISEKWCDYNEAKATPRYSQSLKLPQNQIKRKRMSLAEFWLIHDAAPVYMQIAMQMSLVTLQAQQEVCNMQYSDVRDGMLYVIRKKTAAESDAAFIKIPVAGEVDRLIKWSRQSRIVSPYIVHRIRKSEAPHAKYKPPHPTYVRPKSMSQQFGVKVQTSGVGEHYADRERPTFHEIRSLGARLMEEQGHPKHHIQMLLAHGDKKTSEIYLDNRSQVRDGDYITVDAPLVIRR